RAELERVLACVYGDADWPRPLHLLRGLEAISTGTDIAQTARAIGTTAARLSALSVADDAVAELLGERSSEHDKTAESVRAIIGQLIIGNLPSAFLRTFIDKPSVAPTCNCVMSVLAAAIPIILYSTDKVGRFFA